jgi:hypothetical protein
MWLLKFGKLSWPSLQATVSMLSWKKAVRKTLQGCVCAPKAGRRKDFSLSILNQTYSDLCPGPLLILAAVRVL